MAPSVLELQVSFIHIFFIVLPVFGIGFDQLYTGFRIQKTITMNRLTRISIPVPIKKPGNVIEQKPVDFDLFQRDGHYSLVPCLGQEERRKTNLPEELNFEMKENRPRSLRGETDGNLHIIEDAVRKCATAIKDFRW